VRSYAADGELLAAYPATIGSEENPSPSGTHAVAVVVLMPEYSYNPETFIQGDNTEPLTIPPGPNGPVGSVWIDLTEPGFGIHGTPKPSMIDKTVSHGCVRLTNWDAEELSTLVSKDVPVAFIE
jgi:lipoprotein-anchoring transpeptidase ErfK/SrfK